MVNLLAFAFALNWRNALLGEYQRYQGLATVLLYLLLFSVAAVAVRSARDLRWLLTGLFAGAFAVSVYALMQQVGVAWWPDPMPDRPGSTVGQANELGAYLVVAMSASAFLVLTADRLWQRALFGAGVVVMIAALAVTTSQSAYLAAGLVIVLWGLALVRWGLPDLSFAPAPLSAQPRGRTRAERRRRQRAERGSEGALDTEAMVALPAGALRIAVVALAALPLVLAALIIFFVGLPGREAVVDAFDNENVQGRLNLWWLGVEMAADRPLLGHGQDAYSLLFADYRNGPGLEGIGVRNFGPESSHNFYVDLAANTGVLGLLSFLALVGVVFWYAGRLLLATDDAALRAALLSLGTALAGYLAAIFFGFSEAMTTWVFWLLLGALVGLTLRADAPAGEARPPRPNAIASTAGAVALMAIAVVAGGWATTLVAADLAAAQSQDALAALDLKKAADLADRAATLNPLQKRYLLQEASIYDRAFIAGLTAEQSRERAIELFETALQRFEPQAFDVYQLAEAKRHLAQDTGAPFDDIIPDYERALALDEYNRDLRRQVVAAYRSAGEEERARFHEAIMYCWTPGACK